MTEICDRVLKAGGPALLFEQPKGHTIPVLGNLFGTPQRVALGMGEESVAALREIGKLLAFLKEPEPPKGEGRVETRGRCSSRCCTWRRRSDRRAPCQEIVWEGKDVDLARLPVQTCWPGDVGPLITWGLTVTRGPHKPRQNLGIYRQQVHRAATRSSCAGSRTRGGALDFRDHALAHPGAPFPVAVALGADPATILGAVTPVPDTLSEYQFAGLLRGARTEIVKCIGTTCECRRPREIVLEGFIQPDANDPTGYETAPKAVRRPHRLLQRGRALPGVHRSSASPCAATRSTTRPTPASRRTSRRCWASR